MFRAEVHVTVKRGVLDPQGETVARSLRTLGFDGVRHARIGRYIELLLDQRDEPSAVAAAEEMCRRLLANPVLEEFRVRVSPATDVEIEPADGAEE